MIPGHELRAALRWTFASLAPIALLVLALSFAFEPEAIAAGAPWKLIGLQAPTCPGCWMCGMSRAFSAVSHGQVGAALESHPGVLVVWPLVWSVAPESRRCASGWKTPVLEYRTRSDHSSSTASSVAGRRQTPKTRGHHKPAAASDWRSRGASLPLTEARSGLLAQAPAAAGSCSSCRHWVQAIVLATPTRTIRADWEAEVSRRSSGERRTDRGANNPGDARLRLRGGHGPVDGI